MRCLAKKLDDRYPEAKALSAALAACSCAGDWHDGKADQWWFNQANNQLEAAVQRA